MRRQLARTVLAVTLMVAIAFLLPLAVLVRELVADRAVSAAEQEARSLAGVLAAVADRDSTTAVVDQLNAGSPRRAALLLPDGSVLGADLDVPPVRLAAARDGQAFSYTADGERVVLVPVRTADGEVSVAAVAVARSEMSKGVVAAWAGLAALGAILVVLGVVLADRMARSTVQAIERLGDVTRRLRGGEFHARVEAAGPIEVVQVGHAVNELAAQIETLLAREREAAADLSHRLRTPLTALQLQFDSVRDPHDRDRLEASVRQLTDELTAVIEAARRPRAAGREPVPVDLGETIDRRMAFWRVLARQEARAVEWAAPETTITVAVTEDELIAAVDALLANVFQHTPAGTPFRVMVDGDGGVSRVVVEDDGPGLATANGAARGRSGSGSTGLGLDIVRRTAERADGRLQVGRSPSGGARVEVVFGTT